MTDNSAPTPSTREGVFHDIDSMSPLHRARLAYEPPLPPVLRGAFELANKEGQTNSATVSDEIKALFPNTWNQNSVKLVVNRGEPVSVGKALRIGVVLSGGPAPGGHNTICGLHDFLARRNQDSKVFGFLGGPSGITDCKYIEVTEDLVRLYRNQGGFHLLGSGRTKIETAAQFEKARQTVKSLGLDGLVVVGGDDSNTNAAMLAENFVAHGLSTKVIGIPKTIDGDLRSEEVEVSFGFDTATKVYSELIANLGFDAASAKKSYHFVRLMGRSASHITVECALQTHPNYCLVGEEVAAKKQTLASITQDLADMVCERAEAKKNYGLVLIPEGLIEFVPDVGALIGELNDTLASGVEATEASVSEHLTPESKKVLEFLPDYIVKQLLADRDPHGNVQVSMIETEKLLMSLVKHELRERKAAGKYSGSFNAIPHFFGYEGRCSLPSTFDCNYTYALGHTAAALVEAGQTGVIAFVGNLSKDVRFWQCGGISLTKLMHIEKRHGKDKAVIAKALVDFGAGPFAYLAKERAEWRLKDTYRNPGPIQYSSDAQYQVNFTLQLNTAQE